MTNKGYQHI